jgi:hypothetical protein
VSIYRLLATEAIDGRRKVKAYFCHQQTLNDLNKNNNWEDLEKESFPLHDKGNSRLMAFGHQGVASFRHLELTNFKRDPDKQVCEEKYRIVFTTEQVVAGRTIKLRVSQSEFFFFSLLSYSFQTFSQVRRVSSHVYVC